MILSYYYYHYFNGPTHLQGIDFHLCSMFYVRGRRAKFWGYFALVSLSEFQNVADGWSVLVSHLIEGKKIYHGIVGISFIAPQCSGLYCKDSDNTTKALKT